MARPLGVAHLILQPVGEWAGKRKQLQSDEDLPLGNFQSAGATKIQYCYPVKLMIPQYASHSMCQWIYFMSYGGGLVEGDRLQLTLEVHDLCCALLTTQASTKIYHCDGGMMTRQDITCTVGPGAFLAIIPHTLIPYKQARYTQRQKVSMSFDSNLVLLDWMTAGRMARGEVWQFDSVTSSNQVEVNGEIVYHGAVCFKDLPHQSVAKAMANYQVLGTLLLLGSLLEPLVKKLLAVFGKHKHYDDVYSCDCMTSVSPLTYTVKGGTLCGCVIKFVGQNTTEVQNLVHFMLKDLYSLLGGNPLEQ